MTLFRTFSFLEMRSWTAVFLAAGLTGLSVLPASNTHADVFLLPNSSNNQARFNAATGAVAGTTAEGQTIRVGTTATNVEFVGYMIFDTTAFPTPGAVDLAELTYQTTYSTPSPASYLLYGVSLSALSLGANLSSNAERVTFDGALGGPSSSLIATIDTALTPAGVITFDVTSFVNSQRIGGNNFIAFAFQDPSPTIDGVFNTVQIYDSNDGGGVQNPQLELTVNPIPEPSSLMVFAGMGLCALVRRRK